MANIKVVDPENERIFPGCVGVEGGKIAFVEEGLPEFGDKTVYDGGGLHLSPGFVDIHVHLREPGYEHKETIHTGTVAAASGGFTSVACMPNTSPAIDNKSVVDFILRKAKLSGFAKVYPVAAATVGREGERLTEIGRLVSAGAVAVSDDGAPVSTAQMVRRVLEYASRFDIPLIEHCEDPSTSAGGVMNEGFYSTKLGLPSVPAFSEELCLARDLIVLNAVKSKLHVAHVSTRGAVNRIREAKENGLPVTAETAPHYISLEEKDLETYDTNFRVNPPLRSAEDREAIIEGLKDGTLDCIASDHAPHAQEEKQVEFEYAPPGMIGLETTFSVVLTHLVEPRHLALPQALALITYKAAQALGIPGGTLRKGDAADLVLFDPTVTWIVSSDGFYSKSRNSPYIGRKLSGRVLHTILDGTPVVPSEAAL
ncbi:MAG: amidohydrolase family protein [Candidatus Latescibacteria bacterium]|nr:amidohydrolase family protein [Candidatus Latescibacterota bacterium]NIM22307.1 amidohydrolase family protein [Candidatus Latescibacterota bacterium]NIM66136.1 amidohydrolase family protein [Candidatus Latescibacterota bacterium]NIO02544.1 amidohydrolase family protein [Candidatus Latescibacterota bacterium]NIO29458.1 amidohydrolase family protein [Candidatus Latescibacterota bacterium]